MADGEALPGDMRELEEQRRQEEQGTEEVALMEQ
jgi:hypothetical protein